MRISITFAIFCCFLMGCEQRVQNRPQYESYKYQFQKDMDLVSIDTEFEWADIKEGYSGVCKDGKVYIDDAWWAQASNLERKWLVYHELGHCELGLSHDNRMNEVCPVSIMHKEFPTACFTAHKLNRKNYIVKMYNKYHSK